MPITEVSTSQVFGERLRIIRRRAGLKQSELAMELGVTPRALIRWESGGAINFPLGTLVKLAGRFEVSLDYLLGMTHDMGAT